MLSIEGKVPVNMMLKIEVKLPALWLWLEGFG